jgi:hypothetical protein
MLPAPANAGIVVLKDLSAALLTREARGSTLAALPIRPRAGRRTGLADNQLPFCCPQQHELEQRGLVA